MGECKELIGIGKQYPTKNVPPEVQWAKDDVLRIPTTQLHHFPSPELAVTQFMELKYPVQSAEFITTKPKIWFSTEKPTTDIAILISRAIPSKSFLASLSKEMGQQWLNGAQSISDQRFNNGTDRFPLWAITFWRELVDIAERQHIWRESCQWLADEKQKTQHTPTLDALDAGQKCLDSLGWNTSLPYSRGVPTSVILAGLLGTSWLSDEHINMITEELSETLDPDLANKVIVAPLTFSMEAENSLRSKTRTYTRQTTPLLCRYAKHIEEKGIEELYFPVHVENHWIAGLINFISQTISYG